MAHIAPRKGQVHKMGVHLTGGRIGQKRYEAYKREVEKVARKYGAKVQKGRKFRAK
ncbi:MAG: hypothetical protein HY002_17340 [Candidatus Rokubacteria bacterium]|nr:hypothetical protein [Candidatus Rokubacteria bacterium]